METETLPNIPSNAISGLQDPTPNGATLEQSMDFGLSASLKATATDTFISNPAMALRDMYEYGSDRMARTKDLTAEDANQQYGHLGLHFTRPVSSHYADILAEQKRQEITRQTIQAYGPKGVGAGVLRFGVGLGTSALDPINLASAFIPPLGATRLAAAANITSRMGQRAVTGLVGGVLGAAAVEPLVYGGAQARQADYSLADSLLNITFGAGIGTGLHVAGGYVSDHFLNRKAASMLNPGDVRMPKPVTTGEVVEQMPMEHREAITRTAVGQAANGQLVDVAPLMQAAPQQPGQNLMGSVQTVYDAAGRSYDTQFEVVEAADLVAATAELQPRDRSRIGSDDQINRLAQDMVPERLAESTDAATGAPIVGPDNVVESGNGRVSFIRQAYVNGYASGQKYRDFLKSRGIDVSGYKQPVLVRRRLTDLSAEERKAFVVNAQAVGTMALSASERAGADARLVDKALEVAPLQSANLRASSATKFTRAFLAQIPQSERAGMITGTGEIAQSGISRMKNGLLARAFDDADLLNSVLEETDDNLRTLGNALYESSIAWADMRNSVKAGELSPFVDSTDDLLNAVRFLRRAKDSDVSFKEAIDQGELGGIKGRDARTVETNQWLSLMLRDDGKGNYRLLPKDEIISRINQYVETARNTVPTTDMFGAPPASAEDILRTVRDALKADAERQGLKPQMVDVPQGGVPRVRELASDVKIPAEELNTIRQQVYDDILPADSQPAIEIYHGTNNEFEIFDASMLGTGQAADEAKYGFFLTTNKNEASLYGKNVKSFTAKLENPLIYKTNPNVKPIEEWSSQWGSLISKAKDGGHDGIIIDNGKQKMYVVPDPKKLEPTNSKKEYATKENTPPEKRQSTPLTPAEVVKLDAIDGDSMATQSAIDAAEQVISAKEADLDADLVELESMLKGMGEMSEAEKASLAEADQFIQNQPTIREAIVAAANCVLGK